jgi:anthranilate synthase component 1
MHGADARTLAERVFRAAADEGVGAVWPLWARGGEGPESSELQPSRHLIAGWPTRVDVPTAEALRNEGLEHWLRRHLVPQDAPGAPLQVLLLGYETGWLFDRALAPDWRAPGTDDPPPLVLAVYDRWIEAETPVGPWRWRGPSGGRLAEVIAEPMNPWPALPAAPIRSELADDTPREAFMAGLAAIAAGLAAGDYYQVNLTRRLEAKLAPMDEAVRTAFAWQLFDRVASTQASAFAALFPVTPEAWLVSGSPECLAQWDLQSRRLSTWPIKGTRPRGDDAAADAAQLAELVASPKDRAEHTMIVDLMRNDLGRIAVPGSVCVDGLMTPLGLATVHHLVSAIRCQTQRDCDPPALLRAIFPGGSITGAPRLAAMRAIAALEPRRRDYYCGSLGILRPGDDAVFSILIRTTLVWGDRLRYGTGGGIVSDSNPTDEWLETVHKAEGLRRAIQGLCR